MGHFLHGLSESIALQISGEPSPNKNVAWVVASIFVDEVFLEYG